MTGIDDACRYRHTIEPVSSTTNMRMRYSVRPSDGAKWQGESNSLHCISVLRKSDRPQKMTNSRKCYCLEFSECFQNTSRLSVIQSVRRPICEKKPQADQRLGVICVIEWE